MKNKLLLLVAILNLSIASAQQFIVNGIKYNVTSATSPYTVEVSGGADGQCAASSNLNISGAITLPSSVSDGTTTYSVTSFGASAFSSCTNLTSIVIPNSITAIGLAAFMSCTALTSVTIPNSVTTIGSLAFHGCSNLTSISIPDSVTTMGSNAFANCTNLSSISLSNSLTSIPHSAFYRCKNLTSINIPNSVTSIETYAFMESSLTTLTIPNSVTTIGFRAFGTCDKLTTVSIPSSITFFDTEVFFLCTALTSVTCAIVTPLNNNGIFRGVNMPACSLTVPTGSLDAYKIAPDWKDFNPINGVVLSAAILTNNKAKMYPNPVKNELFITLNSATKTKLEIIDTNGKVLMTKTANSLTNSVDISSLKTGIYFVKLNSNEGTVTKKIIKI